MTLGYSLHTGVDWEKNSFHILLIWILKIPCSINTDLFPLAEGGTAAGNIIKIKPTNWDCKTFYRFFLRLAIFFWWYRVKHELLTVKFYEFYEVDSAQTFLLQGLMLRHQFTLPPFQRNLLFKVEHSKASGGRESSQAKYCLSISF